MVLVLVDGGRAQPLDLRGHLVQQAVGGVQRAVHLGRGTRQASSGIGDHRGRGGLVESAEALAWAVILR